jgi:carboxyl-terminal processing protease
MLSIQDSGIHLPPGFHGMSLRRTALIVRLVVIATASLCYLCPQLAEAQKLTGAERDLALEMLRSADADISRNYYDPKLHGVDWAAGVRHARENIENADSMDSAVSEIAALLDSLHDSHTSLSLPPRQYTLDYGFRFKMVGDHCYVVHVKPGSDAEKKGLKPGTEVLAINSLPLSRKGFWRILYVYTALRPQLVLRLTLQASGAKPLEVDVTAKRDLSKVAMYWQNQGINQIMRDLGDAEESAQPRYFEQGDLLVVKLPMFALSAENVDIALGRMRKDKSVVIDLRSNPGGAVSTLDRFLGAMFENDVKVCDRVTRNGTKAVVVSGRHHDAYTGKLAVLVDSQSASASEVFARVIQLEHRGFIVGDRSSGMVMESVYFPHGLYGVSVTEADLVMNDGKSLERVGVEPDIVALPSAGDLASRRDPALAKAADLVGAQITPEEAGAAFPDKD